MHHQVPVSGRCKVVSLHLQVTIHKRQGVQTLRMGAGSSITISKEHISELKGHAIRAGRKESCALLAGKKDRVIDIFLAENADSNPERRFSIPAEWLINAYRSSEDRGLEIIGIFHSHPSSKAMPSETDIKFMTTNPIAWMIYSVPDDEFCAHIIGDTGTLQSVTVSITERG